MENESCLCSSAVPSREGRKAPTLLHSTSPLRHKAWLSPRDVIHLLGTSDASIFLNHPILSKLWGEIREA